jgi:hypothetical protein
MKNIIFTVLTLGVLSFLAAPVIAGGPMHSNIVQVSHPYHGGHHGGYHGGGYGYHVNYPPVCGYGPVVRPYPVYPRVYYPPVYRPYYYYPRSSFYYATPGFSVGVGF